jgi:hypothetical protein
MLLTTKVGLNNQELRKILTDLGNREVPPPKQRSFQAEGVLLKRMLRVCLQARNQAIVGLAAAARRMDKAAFGSEADFPQAHQALLTGLAAGNDGDWGAGVMERRSVGVLRFFHSRRVTG